MKLKEKLGFRSKNEGKNIPQDVMLEFEECERRLLESNGKRNPYEIIWSLARKHAGFNESDKSIDAGEQPAQDSELDKLPSGRQDVQSGVIDTPIPNQPVTPIPTGNPKTTKRGILSRFFGRKKQ